MLMPKPDLMKKPDPGRHRLLLLFTVTGNPFSALQRRKRLKCYTHNLPYLTLLITQKPHNMKHFLLSTIAFLAFTITCNAQWTSSGSNIFPLVLTNKVGIGTNTPAVKLSVTPSTALSLASGTTSNIPVVNIAPPVGFAGVAIIEGNGGSGAGILALRGNKSANFAYNVPCNNGDVLGILSFEGFSSTTGVSRLSAFIRSTVESIQPTSLSSNLQFVTTDTAGVSSARIYVSANGNVGINTTFPKGYKLAVNGSAIATSMTVKLNADWPDYVFKPTYQLPSLTEIKTYTDKNHHLPGVPAAAEMEKNGINLGEMNMVLLKKVEELTLYLMEQNKQIKEQNKKAEEQRKVNQSLQEQINKIRKQHKSHN
jgi:hypothetical protein